MKAGEHEGHSNEFEPFVEFLIYKRDTFSVHLSDSSL